MSKCAHDKEWNISETVTITLETSFFRGQLVKGQTAPEITEALEFQCFDCGFTKRCTPYSAPKWMHKHFTIVGIHVPEPPNKDSKL